MARARLGVVSSHLLPIAAAAEQRVGVTFDYEDKVSVPARRRTKVRWHEPVRRVLLVKRRGSREVSSVANDVARWLASKGIQVIVEVGDLRDYPEVPGLSTLCTEEVGSQAVDLVVALGGDGTFLHASRLLRFVQRVNHLLPPCRRMGSLGFLATVAAADWRPALARALRGDVDPVPCTLRTRLKVCLRSQEASSPWYALNECAILSRGESIGKLRLFVDGTLVTLVEGDGLLISTPTGSTGYSLSCGGPIVSPSVPGTLLTPSSENRINGDRRHRDPGGCRWWWWSLVAPPSSGLAAALQTGVPPLVLPPLMGLLSITTTI
ncbi:unnamed protein product [Prorocentrum cordatum]|uniref:NAD(+) kinase n=1 Tax=Prorocentrum cordatum TaxID=2364126 RepID=A0ABN9SV82_9DINO|nr:unnamed protein product [Polarella glacialis]